MIFVNLKRPSYFTRLAILGVQGTFMTSFFMTYLVHARYCHRFVGYLEAEIVKVYTDLLKRIDS